MVKTETSKKCNQVTLEQMKKIELDILIFFKTICEKYDLKYSLAYGTLLGAVRHGGFIPWDDDVDVMMPRLDYEKLVKVIKKETNGSHYFLVAPETDSNYYLPLAKLCDSRTCLIQHYGRNEGTGLGVYIDIFVVDGVPETNSERRKFYAKCNYYRHRWNLSSKYYSAPARSIIYKIIRNIILIPHHVIGIRHYLMKYISFCQSYTYSESKYIAVVICGEGEKKETMLKSSFENLRQISFENEMFSVIFHTEEYLSSMYGDYMRLPPENERVGKHLHDVFWKC